MKLKKPTMKIKNLDYFFKIFGDISNIFGILAYLGVTLDYVLSLSYKFKLVIVIFLISIIRNYIKNIGINYQKFQVKKSLRNITGKFNLNNFNEKLPSNYLLDFWLKNANKRAILWSEDSQLLSFNIYLEINKNELQVPLVQVFFYSDWKSEVATFYEGLHISEDFEKVKSKPTQSPVVFFESYALWKKLLQKALSKVSTEISDDYTVCVQNDRITINYMLGRLNKCSSFKIINDHQILEL